VIRSSGVPARDAIAHSPRETTFAPRPPGPLSLVSLSTIDRTSFALSE